MREDKTEDKKIIKTNDAKRGRLWGEPPKRIITIDIPTSALDINQNINQINTEQKINKTPAQEKQEKNDSTRSDLLSDPAQKAVILNEQTVVDLNHHLSRSCGLTLPRFEAEAFNKNDSSFTVVKQVDPAQFFKVKKTGLTTKSTDLDTYKVMLISFQKLYPDHNLKVTAPNEKIAAI